VPDIYGLEAPDGQLICQMFQVTGDHDIHPSNSRNSDMSGIIRNGYGDNSCFHIFMMELARFVFIIVYGLEAVLVNQSEKLTLIR